MTKKLLITKFDWLTYFSLNKIHKWPPMIINSFLDAYLILHLYSFYSVYTTCSNALGVSVPSNTVEAIKTLGQVPVAPRYGNTGCGVHGYKNSDLENQKFPFFGNALII